jgi:hypothetical protein
LALDNLGRDLQDLEKVSLARVTSGGTGGDDHIDWSDGIHTGGGRDPVGENHITYLNVDESELLIVILIHEYIYKYTYTCVQ